MARGGDLKQIVDANTHCMMQHHSCRVCHLETQIDTFN